MIYINNDMCSVWVAAKLEAISGNAWNSNKAKSMTMLIDIPKIKDVMQETHLTPNLFLCSVQKILSDTWQQQNPTLKDEYTILVTITNMVGLL